MDAQRLKDNFAQVAAHGGDVALFFYSDLFLRNPGLRDLFPVSMSAQRDRLLGALAQIVSSLGDVDYLVPFLQGLGRDHRKYGVTVEHYEAVGASLIATLAEFSGESWTGDLAATWEEAYGLAASVMIEAAAKDEISNPPWWDGVVVQHELRSPDIAVFRVATTQRLTFEPGQAVAIESPQRPRIWRFFSIANAPRADGSLDFHVRMIAGGALSPVLTRGIAVGSPLRLGPPVSELRVDPSSGRGLLLAAGSTGLAPLKALVQHLAGLDNPPPAHLFFGARTSEGLYDLADLEAMAARWPWLAVTPAVSHDAGFEGEQGLLSDVVTRCGIWRDLEACVCGSTPMVTAMVERLAALGVPRALIHTQDFGWSQQ